MASLFFHGKFQTQCTDSSVIEVDMDANLEMKFSMTSKEIKGHKPILKIGKIDIVVNSSLKINVQFSLFEFKKMTKEAKSKPGFFCHVVIRRISGSDAFTEFVPVLYMQYTRKAWRWVLVCSKFYVQYGKPATRDVVHTISWETPRELEFDERYPVSPGSGMSTDKASRFVSYFLSKFQPKSTEKSMGHFFDSGMYVCMCVSKGEKKEVVLLDVITRCGFGNDTTAKMLSEKDGCSVMIYATFNEESYVISSHVDSFEEMKELVDTLSQKEQEAKSKLRLIRLTGQTENIFSVVSNLIFRLQNTKKINSIVFTIPRTIIKLELKRDTEGILIYVYNGTTKIGTISIEKDFVENLKNYLVHEEPIHISEMPIRLTSEEGHTKKSAGLLAKVDVHGFELIAKNVGDEEFLTDLGFSSGVSIKELLKGAHEPCMKVIKIMKEMDIDKFGGFELVSEDIDFEITQETIFQILDASIQAIISIGFLSWRCHYFISGYTKNQHAKKLTQDIKKKNTLNWTEQTIIIRAFNELKIRNINGILTPFMGEMSLFQCVIDLLHRFIQTKYDSFNFILNASFQLHQKKKVVELNAKVAFDKDRKSQYSAATFLYTTFILWETRVRVVPLRDFQHVMFERAEGDEYFMDMVYGVLQESAKCVCSTGMSLSFSGKPSDNKAEFDSLVTTFIEKYENPETPFSGLI